MLLNVTPKHLPPQAHLSLQADETAIFVHESLYLPNLHHKYTAIHRSLVLQPPPEDTSTELDPKYKVTYLSASEAAAQPRDEDVQEEAVAASYTFSKLEASLSGVPVSPSNAEAISRLGMTASTSGTTAATEQSKIGCHHFECVLFHMLI